MDTIAAISTAPGKGGIGIIRMSGKESFTILNKMFIPKTKEKIAGYKIKYGKIVDRKGNVLDEVLVSYFINPKSYTRENMCEINSHGGYVVEKGILEQCLKNGARLAEPGEFTKRAFLNGRIDLSQAEAVIDIINSNTEKERKAAINQLEGGISKKIGEIQKMLLDIMADIEASIDYPEYDIEEMTENKLNKTLFEVNSRLTMLSNSYKNGKIIKNGIKTAIIGKPNVGKSSLLNLMLNEERAIVSEKEGTTRDLIEESINVKGIELKIIDTAGIRDTTNEVEKIGIKKAINVISQAELIIAVLDDSHALEKEDYKILNLIKDKHAIILLNKSDLNMHKIEKKGIENKTIEFSTKTGEGIEELYNEIIKIFNITDIEMDNKEIITNIRQKQYIDYSIESTKKAQESILKKMPIDIISIYIKEILENLGTITGQNVSEDIIKEIFSKFCLGK